MLERIGAPAIFFVSGRPLAERRALSVHKIHALRERLDDAAFAARLDDTLAAARIARPAVSAEEALAHYRYDGEAVARVKFLLNMVLAPQDGDAVVDRLFEEEIPDEAGFVDDLYMTADQVAELERAHAAIGAHSYGHHPLALLDDEALDRDLEKVAALLREITGTRPLAFSYPYGTPQTVDERAARRLKATGYEVGFTSERAANTTLEEPLLLARMDTNDLPVA
ncbi:MAG: hypothetical protein AUG74_09980 [Bacteroidetes bacterium 13_1_20CM_4_60_6]|nr:MAG: hypothetical protein AUG74_09980 [Bacteroidetes bacterium 13_1_20CM_4_60_6]